MQPFILKCCSEKFHSGVIKVKRRYNAIQIFIDFMEKEGRVPTEKEFDEIWRGGEKYYYQVKRKFLKDIDFYMEAE